MGNIPLFAPGSTLAQAIEPVHPCPDQANSRAISSFEFGILAEKREAKLTLPPCKLVAAVGILPTSRNDIQTFFEDLEKFFAAGALRPRDANGTARSLRNSGAVMTREK
jgi:hypothetical protein